MAQQALEEVAQEWLKRREQAVNIRSGLIAAGMRPVMNDSVISPYRIEDPALRALVLEKLSMSKT